MGDRLLITSERLSHWKDVDDDFLSMRFDEALNAYLCASWRSETGIAAGMTH
jgi:hypothetical protein